MEDETLKGEIRLIAEKCKSENAPEIGIVLFTLLGSINSGHLNELASICVNFSKLKSETIIDNLKNKNND